VRAQQAVTASGGVAPPAAEAAAAAASAAAAAAGGGSSSSSSLGVAGSNSGFASAGMGGREKTVTVVVKADVDGSAEALSTALSRLEARWGMHPFLSWSRWPR